MKVKVVKEFIDRENDLKHRKVGETFEACAERARQLETLGYVKKAMSKDVVETAQTEEKK